MPGPRVNREVKNRPKNPVGRDEETKIGAETPRIAVGPPPENHPKRAGIGGGEDFPRQSFPRRTPEKTPFQSTWAVTFISTAAARRGFAALCRAKPGPSNMAHK